MTKHYDTQTIIKKEIIVIPDFGSYSSTTIKAQAMECIRAAIILAVQQEFDVCIDFEAVAAFEESGVIGGKYRVSYREIIKCMMEGNNIGGNWP